jgi:DNA repair ATPase RecN
MADNVQELLQMMADFRAETTEKMEQMQMKLNDRKEIKDKIDRVEKALEYQKQLVNEYKLYKDPNSQKEAVKALQAGYNGFETKIQNLSNRLKEFEMNDFIRLLSDEELEQQHERCGKPSMNTIAKHFRTTPENAYNYVHGKIKDPKIRWAFYKFCNDHAKKLNKE